MRLAGVEVRDGAAAQLACLLQPHNEGLAFHLGEAIAHLHEHFTLTARASETPYSASLPLSALPDSQTYAQSCSPIASGK